MDWNSDWVRVVLRRGVFRIVLKTYLFFLGALMLFPAVFPGNGWLWLPLSEVTRVYLFI